MSFEVSWDWYVLLKDAVTDIFAKLSRLLQHKIDHTSFFFIKNRSCSYVFKQLSQSISQLLKLNELPKKGLFIVPYDGQMMFFEESKGVRRR